MFTIRSLKDTSQRIRAWRPSAWRHADGAVTPDVHPFGARVWGRSPLSRRQAGCAGGCHEGNRGLVAEGPVRSIPVMVLAPILQLFPGVGKGQKPVRVQALGA
jgi:hypothetical protein